MHNLPLATTAAGSAVLQGNNLCAAVVLLAGVAVLDDEDWLRLADHPVVQGHNNIRRYSVLTRCMTLSSAAATTCCGSQPMCGQSAHALGGSACLALNRSRPAHCKLPLADRPPAGKVCHAAAWSQPPTTCTMPAMRRRQLRSSMP